jgi:hypothetical protein
MVDFTIPAKDENRAFPQRFGKNLIFVKNAVDRRAVVT